MTQTVLLGDLMAEKGYIRGPFGSALRRPEMKSEGIPVYEQQNAIYNHRDFRFFIDDQKHEELKRFTVKPGDLLISCSGTLGKITIIRPGDPIGVISQALLILRVDSDKVLPEYLYYFLTSARGQRSLLGASHGSVQTNIAKRAVVEAIKIELPSLPEQQKIADILGTIDEKIELNRQMNETLEQMGQALFRHYFIDNPEAEKWEKRELGEFFPIKTGKKDANFGTEDGEYPFFTCAQTISKAPDFSFDAHALLLAGNGDFNLKLYRGKFEAYQRTYVLIPDDERFVGILYFLMKMKLPEITGGSRGSVIKFITKGMIENYKFALPNDSELAEMSEVFNQITINIEENVKEIQTLTTLRDTLLPQLISGKVKV